MRSRGFSRGVSVFVAFVLSQGILGATCSDGATPDCTDAAAQCSPIVGDASSDSNAPRDASAGDAGADN